LVPPQSAEFWLVVARLRRYQRPQLHFEAMREERPLFRVASPERSAWRVDHKRKEEMAIVNKDQLAHAVAERAGLNNSQAKMALDATLDEIAAQLGAGNEVRLTGFGKFSVNQRAAREGRNPQTGATMQIPAKTVPKFGAGAELKKAVE
jgi:DNA-binding protein HU-beta